MVLLNDIVEVFGLNDMVICGHLAAAPYGTDPETIKDTLCAQIYSSVQWVDTVRYVRDKGAGDFQEISPKPVLTGMLKKIA